MNEIQKQLRSNSKKETILIHNKAKTTLVFHFSIDKTRTGKIDIIEEKTLHLLSFLHFKPPTILFIDFFQHIFSIIEMQRCLQLLFCMCIKAALCISFHFQFKRFMIMVRDLIL
jgi:hypothetical protein